MVCTVDSQDSIRLTIAGVLPGIIFHSFSFRVRRISCPSRKAVYFSLVLCTLWSCAFMAVYLYQVLSEILQALILHFVGYVFDGVSHSHIHICFRRPLSPFLIHERRNPSLRKFPDALCHRLMSGLRTNNRCRRMLIQNVKKRLLFCDFL